MGGWADGRDSHESMEVTGFCPGGKAPRVRAGHSRSVAFIFHFFAFLLADEESSFPCAYPDRALSRHRREHVCMYPSTPAANLPDPVTACACVLLRAACFLLLASCYHAARAPRLDIAPLLYVCTVLSCTGIHPLYSTYILTPVCMYVCSSYSTPYVPADTPPPPSTPLPTKCERWNELASQRCRQLFEAMNDDSTSWNR